MVGKLEVRTKLEKRKTTSTPYLHGRSLHIAQRVDGESREIRMYKEYWEYREYWQYREVRRYGADSKQEVSREGVKSIEEHRRSIGNVESTCRDMDSVQKVSYLCFALCCLAGP